MNQSSTLNPKSTVYWPSAVLKTVIPQGAVDDALPNGWEL